MRFYIAKNVCTLRTQITMEIEGGEGKVSVVNSEDPLLEVLAGSDCISSSVQVPAEADVTQQKGKHCYQYYKLLLVSRTKLMFQ